MSDIQIVQFATQTMASNYVTVAAVVTLLYDYTLTFAEEVEFVWQQKMSFGKILFLLNRYIPMADLVILMNSYVNQAIRDEKFCTSWWQVDTWLAVLSIAIINTLLLLRTWAIWGRSRNVFLSLSVLWILCLLTGVGSTLYEALTVIGIPSPGIRPCLSTFPNPNLFYGSCASTIVWDCTILVLTLIKVLPTLQLDRLTPLFSRLLRDGVLYFVIISMASIANIIVIKAAPPALADMLFPFYRSIAVVLCSRLVLNLRGLLLHPADCEDTANTIINLKPLVFNGGQTVQESTV